MKNFRHIVRVPALALGALLMAWTGPLAAQDANAAQSEQQTSVLPDVEIFDVEIVAEYPHDPNAFTQGLLFHDGFLYESTGREGTSQVRRVDLETGEVLAASDIPADQFGEGLTRWNDQLISLTWQHGIVHRWSISDLSPISSTGGFPFEFWGLTTLDDQLVFSDGSPTLRFVDAETFEVQRELDVSYFGQPLVDINELEVIDGLIWANIWFSRTIVAIDPETGEVVKAASLRPVTDRIVMVENGAVLNGIAYDEESGRMFVTGKLWPTLFEIRLVPQAPLVDPEDQPVPVPVEEPAG